MTNYLPTPGTFDFYTADLNAGILAAGNDTGWLGPYSGATASTIDPTANSGVVTWKYNFSAAGTLTITVTPAGTVLAGQRLRIVVNAGAYNVSLVMPSNFFYKRGATFVPPQNCRSVIEFQYDESATSWYEINRSAVKSATPVAGGWQNLTLNAAWAGLGGWQTPQYRIEDGWVSFRGVITTSAGVGANTNLFTLPAGFLPLGNEVQGGAVYNGTAVAAGMVSFLTTGNAQTLVAVGAGGFIGLTGLRYQID